MSYKNQDFNGYRAWRYLNGARVYVQASHKGPGDRYAYTDKVEKAARMSAQACRRFCNYMHQCDSVGFWGVAV